MALERVFEYPRTLRRMRGGPLGKLLEGFCNWLLEHGFRRQTIRKHLFHVSHLNEHLGGPRSGVYQSISLREVEGFSRAYPWRCRNRGVRGKHLRRVGYSVNRFLAYLRDSGLLDSLPPKEIYQPLLGGYLQWMRHYQRAADGTLQVRSHSITQFLKKDRPPCSARHVFIRLKAPRRGFANSEAISTLVARALKRAGIDSPHMGAHLFRHTLATQMLRQGASLADIAHLLRHRSFNTTTLYAKVDLMALQPLAQPWPGGAQ